MATINLPTTMSLLNPDPTTTKASDRLVSSRNLSDFVFQPRRKCFQKQLFSVRSMKATEQSQHGQLTSQNGPLGFVSFAFLAHGFFNLFLIFSFWISYSLCLLKKCGKKKGNGVLTFGFFFFFFGYLVTKDGCFIN